MAAIDPSAVVSAISDGASWSSNHLVEDGTDKWCKVNGLSWELSTSSGDKKMRAAVYDQLVGAIALAATENRDPVNPDNTITCPAGVYQLSVSGSYAVLTDPS